jgi:hypothetical protein
VYSSALGHPSVVSAVPAWSGSSSGKTRSRRLTEFVAMLSRGETIYPQRRRRE